MEKKPLDKLVYGVYIVSLKSGSIVNAFTASWVSRVSFSPPLIMVAIHKNHYSHQLIQEGKNFALNILDKEQKELARLFYTPVTSESDPRVGVHYITKKTGAPILKEALAYLDCQVVSSIDTGDHTIFIGEVIDSEVLKEGQSLTTEEMGERYCEPWQ